jgi:hypothetical protein
LPNSAVIIGAGKIPDMISKSSIDICGEDDLRCPHSREDGIPAGLAGIVQAENAD